MAFNLTGFLKAAAEIGKAGLQHAPEIMEMASTAITLLRPQDQDTAKAALADLRADNAEGFARLDAKLAEAEKR